MKRVLIAGGAGFIGSNLCRYLLKNTQDEIICLDNLYSTTKNKIYELTKFDKFEFIRHDITTPLYIEVDEIYNLACPASPINYQKDPVQTMKSNILGSINLLGLAKRLNISIFQASTSEIYGDPNISPQIESYFGNVNPIGPRSCYDEGKRASETLFMDYHKMHGVKVKIARIFNTYGPYMSFDDGRVVSNFINQCLKNKPITIYGNGLQTRSFCYIDDLTKIIFLLMSDKSGFTGPMNIGNPNNCTILELANLIISLTNSKSKLEFRELPKDDPKVRQPDISLAESKFDWSPKVNLEEGLKKTISYFDNIISNKNLK